MENTNEIIWEKNDKEFDFSQVIIPDVIKVTPEYRYWRSQAPLDYNLLRNKPNIEIPTKNYYISDVTFSCPTSTSTTASFTAVNSTTWMNVTRNRATITKAWIYQVSANITWNSNSASWFREVAVVINWSNYFIVSSDNAKSSWWSYTNLSWALSLNVWDYVTLILSQDSWTTIWNNGSSNQFSIVEI